MAQVQITEDSGLSKHMSKKLQMLLPALKSQTRVAEGTIDLLPGENWTIRKEATEFYKTTIAGSDLSKVRFVALSFIPINITSAGVLLPSRNGWRHRDAQGVGRVSQSTFQALITRGAGPYYHGIRIGQPTRCHSPSHL